MSFFEGQLNPAWSPQHRPQQQSWDQPGVPSRSGSTSAASQREESNAFSHQFEEISRAAEILSKSNRSFPMHGRRESLPPIAPGQFSRQFDAFDRANSQMRHHSMSEYDARSPSSASSSSYQGFVANQRFGPRPSEAEQMLQAKRRAAAQRERELRNYHQEQQYNRTGAKNDRAMSPGAMSEEDRRELIQRQHRALYGDSSNIYSGDGSRPGSQDSRALAGAGPHGAVPLGYDSYGHQGPDGSVPPGPPRDGANSSSPSSSAGPGRPLGVYDTAQGVAVASNSSPGSASPTRAPSKGPAPPPGVAPIGTRPLAASAAGKRGTPPAPSPLSYGAQGSERSQSAASNPNPGAGGVGGSDKSGSLGWSGNNGPWGGAVQSVWS